MKLPGTDVHVHMPEWPLGFDLMSALYQGVHIRIEKKTGEIFIQVDRPASPPESTIYARTREEASDDP